jgi:hypothetical protein
LRGFRRAALAGENADRAVGFGVPFGMSRVYAPANCTEPTPPLACNSPMAMAGRRLTYGDAHGSILFCDILRGGVFLWLKLLGRAELVLIFFLKSENKFEADFSRAGVSDFLPPEKPSTLAFEKHFQTPGRKSIGLNIHPKQLFSLAQRALGSFSTFEVFRLLKFYRK